MLPKAILFDLDDTIISSEGASEKAWEKSCMTFVQNINTGFTGEDLLNIINKTRKWYWGDPERHKTGRMDMDNARRHIVRTALKELQYFDEIAVHGMADSFIKLQHEMTCLFPDSIHTLDCLKELGIRMVLITNGTSEKQRDKINRFCLSGYFDFCLIEGEVGFGKPDPRVFQIALEKMGLDVKEVWMVGDNLVWDIDAPQKLGIFSIWNDFRKNGLPEGSAIVPDRIIHSIAELLE